MTLDELQAEFPIGSRWTTTPIGGEYTIAGAYVHPMEHMGLTLVCADRDGRLSLVDPNRARATYRRLPDPVPCPITEPTTLHRQSAHRIAVWSPTARICHQPSITLHPAEPGATEGRYTWEQP